VVTIGGVPSELGGELQVGLLKQLEENIHAGFGFRLHFSHKNYM
jgi:hypothetical protein